MTERKEFKGDTVDEAKASAAEYFGVEPDDLDVKVLFKAGQGVVGGGGGGKAIIVAVPKGAAAPPEAQMRHDPTQPRPREYRRDGPPSSPRREHQRRDQRGGREAGGRWDRDRGPRRERGSGQREAPRRAAPEPAAPIPPLFGEGPYGQLSEGVAAIASEAEAVLRDILDRTGLGMTYEINAAENDEEVYIDAKGDGSGLLIGKGGQTLEAIQYLVSKIVQRKTQVRKRVFVDFEGYRKRQVAQLRDLALMLGTKAKRAGKAIEMEPMNSFDRRIVHITLEAQTGVTTMSVGEGEYKKLIITPRGRDHR